MLELNTEWVAFTALGISTSAVMVVYFAIALAYTLGDDADNAYKYAIFYIVMMVFSMSISVAVILKAAFTLMHLVQ